MCTSFVVVTAQVLSIDNVCVWDGVCVDNVCDCVWDNVCVIVRVCVCV